MNLKPTVWAASSVLFVAWLMADPTYATTFHVRDYTPTGAENGLSWGTAFNTLQEAINAANGTLQQDDIILIAASQPGTAWKPGSSTLGAWGAWPTGAGDPPLPPSTFKITAQGGQVTIRGSYATDGSGDPDPGAHPTILSGDLLGNDSALAGLEDDATNDDNAYHVLTVLDIGGPQSIIDGLVIERGNVAELTGPPIPDELPDSRGGAGIVLSATPEPVGNGSFRTTTFAQPYLQNCVVQLNAGHIGGGVLAVRTWPSQAMPTLHVRTSTIRANRASVAGEANAGAGVLIANGGLEMFGSLVVDKLAEARFSGGIAVQAQDTSASYGLSQVHIEYCTIANNIASGDWAGVAWTGLSAESSVTLESSILALNRAAGASGTVDTQFGGANTEEGFTLVVEYCAFPIGYAPTHAWQSEVFDVQDPYFLAAGDATPILQREYRLRGCSTARDMGQPATPLLPLDTTDVDHDLDTTEYLPDRDWSDGSGRVLESDWMAGPRVDIGAFEHADQACVGDADQDGAVDADDLAILLGAWNCPHGFSWEPCDIAYPASPNPTPCICLDLDRDGCIGQVELAQLLGGWGPCPNGAQAMQGAAGMAELEGGSLSPLDLAALFGFDSIDDLAAWLASLSPEARAAVLSLLGTIGGGT